MKEKIYSLDDLNQVIDEISFYRMMGYKIFFRGQSSEKEYKLYPQLCRSQKSIEELREIEENIVKCFEEELIKQELSELIQESELWEKYKYGREWTVRFQYQHLGLPTRLLDWSASHKTALYFAVEDKRYWEKDGQFWIYQSKDEVFYSQEHLDYLNTSINNISGISFINQPTVDNPTIGEERRRNQNGIFSVQDLESAIIPFEEQKNLKGILTKIIVDGNSKEQIFEELNEDDINHRKMYLQKFPVIDEIINSLKERFRIL